MKTPQTESSDVGINVPFAKKWELSNTLSLQSGVGQNIALHASPAARNFSFLRFLTLFFWSYLCLIGPFNYMSLYESLLQPWYKSPRAHLPVVGMSGLCQKDIIQPSLPTLIFCSCVYFCLYGLSTVFHSTNSPDNSPLSHSVHPVLFLPYRSFQLYTTLWKHPVTLL